MPTVKFANEEVTTIKYEDYPELKQLGTPVIQVFYWYGNNYLAAESLPFIAIGNDPGEIIIDHREKATGKVVIN